VKRSNLWVPGLLGALFLPFSNIGLGSLLYPHVELIGTSLVAIGILLLTVRWLGTNNRWLFVISVLSIFFGLFAREDIGVHLVITVGSAVLCSQWKKLGRQGLIRAGSLIVAGLSACIALMGYQRFFAESEGVFALTYSGTPAYAHITSVWYLIGRVLHLFASRLDLIVGVAAFVMAALVLRKREFLAFPVAVTPWLLLNLTAIDPAKNAMGIYHLFPIILYAAAPALALILTKPTRSSESDSTDSSRGRIPMYATYGVAILSLFLGGISASPTGGGFLFTSVLRLPLISPAGITATHHAIEKFAELESGIAVDDAVMSIRPVDLEGVSLIPTVQDSSQINSVMFFPRYLLGHESVRRLFTSWAVENRKLLITCLPGGLVRADAGLPSLKKTDQTDVGQFDKALRCHPLPIL
jgi:hypothetical protein